MIEHHGDDDHFISTIRPGSRKTRESSDGPFRLLAFWTPFYLTIAFLPSAGVLRRGLKRPSLWYPLITWLGFSYFMALLEAIGFTLRWWKPFHESITIFDFGFLCVLPMFLYVDIRRYFSTRKVRTQLRINASKQTLSGRLSCS
jgi:hypothetical protein